MDITQIILLALIQGITEFLPISSSAHLILIPTLANWKDQGLSFDIAVHFGTLMAVIWYFRKDLSSLLIDWTTSIKIGKDIGQSNFAWAILLATIPIVIAGVLFKDLVEIYLRDITIIAYATIIFAILLGLADYINRNFSQIRTRLNWFDVIMIGSFQVLALIPGTSRAGITISAALLLGISRELSIKFAFLLAIPTIGLSALALILAAYQAKLNIDWQLLLLAFSVAALSAYLVIVFFIKFITKIGFMPFVIYRLLLGTLLLFWG